MLGSSVTNHQQHVGLQKLSALAGITHSSLGPSKKYKFIQDDASGESALVCSCFRVFENLELSCAVGQLVHETLQAHHRVYHTGSGCLLFLAGAWSRAALECRQRGISVAHIISAMSEGMEICLGVCKKCSFSTEGLGVDQSESCTATSHTLGLSKKYSMEGSQASCQLQGMTKADHKPLNGSGQRKVKLSRHFYESPPTGAHQPPDIAHIAEGLSHGCVDAMNLVVEASRIQSQNNLQDISFTFDVTNVVTCVLPGLPEQHACVLPGCVVGVSAQQESVAHHLTEQHLKVALINGDLSPTYRHRGFKRPSGIQRVSGQVGFSSSSQEWMEKVVTLVLNLDVKLILVSGLAGDGVIQRCCTHHILVVEKVKPSIFRTFSKTTGAVPVTYATQLSGRCVGSGVTVAVWRDVIGPERNPSTTVNICTVERSQLVTVILTSCVRGKLQALEDQFWACAYRLHHALKDKALLPGAGVTEMLCARRLLKQAEHHREERADPHRPAVLHLMADGLIDYISTVVLNSGKSSRLRARTAVSRMLQDYSEAGGFAVNISQLLEGERDESGVSSAVNIYDNVSVKQEAWRKALDLLFLVLQTDAEVITGTEHTGDATHLMLL